MAEYVNDKLFSRLENNRIALTYDDVRLDTGPSDYNPQEVDLTSRFSRRVELKTPLTSAAMDTVTESEMAIAIAKLGGLGVIHAGLSIKKQRKEVRRVKLHLNGLIENPRYTYETKTLLEIENKFTRKNWPFRTIPVLDGDKKFVGLLTQNDFDFSHSEKYRNAFEVMTPADVVTIAEPETTVHEAYELMKQEKKKTLPLINKDGELAGLYVWSDVDRIINDNKGLYNTDEKGQLMTAAAVPTDEDALKRVKAMESYLDVAVIDSAQGDSKYAFKTLRQLKEEFPDIDIVVGNITSPISAARLVEEGADGIKVGQGPGSICTTRIETGIGHPQVSAVYRCAKAIRDSGVPVCADGGLRNPGDIAVALVAGVGSVMMGSMLAGTKETPGKPVLKDGNLVKLYRGMGSPEALKDSAASRKRYGQGEESQALAEGVSTEVPYKGSVVDALTHYILAIGKSMSYVGAKNIETYHKKTPIFRITNAGYKESTPHIQS